MVKVNNAWKEMMIVGRKRELLCGIMILTDESLVGWHDRGRGTALRPNLAVGGVCAVRIRGGVVSMVGGGGGVVVVTGRTCS